MKMQENLVILDKMIVTIHTLEADKGGGGGGNGVDWLIPIEISCLLAVFTHSGPVLAA